MRRRSFRRGPEEVHAPRHGRARGRRRRRRRCCRARRTRSTSRRAKSRSRPRDGECDAYFAAPTTGARAAVLVWPDIFGLRPAFRQMGKRLAESGYAVLVVNPFYRTKKAPTAPNGASTPIPDVMPLAQTLNRTDAHDRCEGVHCVARQQSQVDKHKKVGTIGYCMGGPIVMRTAAAVPNRVGPAARSTAVASSRRRRTARISRSRR